MTKQEISEIKKLFTPKNCSITRICGCYVDGEKNKKTELKQAFLALPEEEMFKYFEILRKSLSGSIGKNLLNLEFPLESENEGGTQEFLLRLRDSRLRDDALLEQFYDRVIESYEYVGNYLILLIHDAYDVPGRTRDGIEMEDASDEVYEYLLTCICPVDLSKPGLSYNAVENTLQNRIRDWVVGMPDTAFLFPAFNDRSTDLHSTLYYSKDAEELKENFVDLMLGCPLPLSAGGQKETFQALVEETLGNTCDIETVKNIHEKMSEIAQEHKEDPAPVVLDKNEVKTIFASSGVANDRMEIFGQCFDDIVGKDTKLMLSNIYSNRGFEVKAQAVTVKVNPERTDLVGTKVIDGRKCLVIELDGKALEEDGLPLSDDIDSKKICDKFVEFYRTCIQKYGRVDWVFPDSASPTMINSLRSAAKEAGLPYQNIKGCRKNEISERPKTVDMLFNSGRLKINKRCVQTRKAIASLRWDEDHPDQPEDKNIGNVNDRWDSFCYTWLDFVEYIDLKR